MYMPETHEQYTLILRPRLQADCGRYDSGLNNSYKQTEKELRRLAGRMSSRKREVSAVSCVTQGDIAGRRGHGSRWIPCRGRFRQVGHLYLKMYIELVLAFSGVPYQGLYIYIHILAVALTSCWWAEQGYR